MAQESEWGYYGKMQDNITEELIRNEGKQQID